MLPAPSPEVIFKRLSEGAVLFDTTQEVYFGLNTVGARIWELLSSSQTLDELCDRLAADYPDVERSSLRTDVQALLSQLGENRLVRTTSTSDTDERNVAIPVT